MIIRDYQAGDFDKISCLWESLGMGGKERNDSEDSINRTLEMGGRLLLMIDPEKDLIIGTSWMTFDGRRIYLHHFGIHKEYQDRGLGTRLAVESLKHIKNEGYQVKLEVHKLNQVAKHLYEKLGFFAFRDYDIYMIRNTQGITIDNLS